MLGALSSFVESRELNLQARFTLRKHIPAALQKPHLHDQIHSYFHEDHERAIIRLDTSYEHSPNETITRCRILYRQLDCGEKELRATLLFICETRYVRADSFYSESNRLEPIGTDWNRFQLIQLNRARPSGAKWRAYSEV